MFEAMHVFLDANADITVRGDLVLEIVVYYSVIRDVGVFHLYEFGFFIDVARKISLISAPKNLAPLEASEMVLLMRTLVSSKLEAGDPTSFS